MHCVASKMRSRVGNRFLTTFCSLPQLSLNVFHAHRRRNIAILRSFWPVILQAALPTKTVGIMLRPKWVSFRVYHKQGLRLSAFLSLTFLKLLQSSEIPLFTSLYGNLHSKPMLLSTVIVCPLPKSSVDSLLRRPDKTVVGFYGHGWLRDNAYVGN